MEQTAVEWLYNKMLYIDNEYDMKLITKNEYQFKRRDIIEQAKEMEKQQIINCGNSCALKHHLHSDRINKMSIEELEQYDLEPSYTFGEEYYNETFNK